MMIGPAARVEPAVTGGDRSRRSSAPHPERQLLGRERLGEVVVGAEREAADPVGLLPPRGQEDDAHVAGLLPLPQLGQHVVARDAGQHQVEDDDVGPLLPRGPERVGAVGRRGDPEARLGEVIRHQRRDVGLVVHHEDAVRHAASWRGASSSTSRLQHPCVGMRSAPIRGALPLRPQLGVVPDQGVEHRGEQAAGGAGVAAQPVEHELGDRRVAHQLGLPEHLEVTGDGGLGQVEHCLEIGDEEGRRREAVEDPEPGGLRDGEEDLGRRGGTHMRRNIYTARGMDKP